MARIRTVKPELFFDEDLAIHPVKIRYFFIGLFNQADGKGRMEDRPGKLKASIFPYEKFDADAALNSLATPIGQRNKVFIIRYVTPDSKRFIQIVNFTKHQRITGKEAELESLFPPPPDDGETPGKQLGNNVETPDAQERKGKERNGKDIYKPDWFVQVWSKYPKKAGKGKAEEAFKASVKTEADLQSIYGALENYLASQRVKDGFVQDGSRWFKSWRDWIDYKEELKQNGKTQGAVAGEPGKYAAFE